MDLVFAQCVHTAYLTHSFSLVVAFSVIPLMSGYRSVCDLVTIILLNNAPEHERCVAGRDLL